MAQNGLFMPKYVAFLGAINVGGRGVKMGRLRPLLEAWKCSNVETFWASQVVTWLAVPE